MISADSILALAHSVDVPNLEPKAAKALAPDVEYRLRELIQDAQKFARHSKRLRLTTEDVNNALRLRNVEPVYGFAYNKDPAKYIKAIGHADVYCIQDRELTFDQLIDAPLPKPPVEVGVLPHWLFIEGVQPATPENAQIEKPTAKRLKQTHAGPSRMAGPAKSKPASDAAAGQAPSSAAAAGGAAAGAAAAGTEEAPQGVVVQPPVQHVLSQELQLYFERVVAVMSGDAAAAAAAGVPASGAAQQQQQQAAAKAALESQQNAVLASLTTDPGLHPLAPYLVKYIADSVAGSLRSIPSLHLLLRMARSVLLNQAIQLEPYAHQLMPPILTCLVAKTLGSSASEDHWSVRDKAAQLVALVCSRFSDPYHNVQPRVSKTLIKALLDPGKPLATHYGAVVGLAALGHDTVRLLLIPQLEPYMQRLQPLMGDQMAAAGGAASSQGGAAPMEVTGPAAGEAQGAAGSGRGKQVAAAAAAREQAGRVHSALLDAVAGAMYQRCLSIMGDSLSDQQLAECTRSRRPVVKLKEDGGPAPAWRQKSKTWRKPGASGGVGVGAADGADAAAGAAGDGEAGGVAEADAAAGGGKDAMDVDGAPAQPAVKAGKEQAARKGEAKGDRSVREVLAASWHEDADVNEVLWALTELFGDAFTARMPQPKLTA